MSLTWNPGNKLTPEHAWAADLIEKLVWGRKATRLTPAQLTHEDTEYLAKGLGRREIGTIGRTVIWPRQDLDAVTQAAIAYYTPLAAEVVAFLDAGAPDAGTARLVAVLTDDLPARVAQHAANAEHGIARAPRPKERELFLSEFEDPNPYAIDDARHEAWEEFLVS